MEYRLWVKKELLPFFANGRKDLEVRTCRSGGFSRVNVDDWFFVSEQLSLKVVAIRRYANFELMLRAEDPRRIHPEMGAIEVLRGLRAIYSTESELAGVIVFELAPT
jgi:ASC-1-like (ASCH) protein